MGKAQKFSFDSWLGNQTLGASSDISCWILDVPHYHRPHIGCQLPVMDIASLLCTGPTELKTPTLSAGIDILIYLPPPTHRQWDTRRHSLVIDTLTIAEEGVNKGLHGKEILWKKTGDYGMIKELYVQTHKHQGNFK